MLTIKCTKSCPWGVHHAWGPVFQIEPDMVLNTEECPTNTNPADWKAFFQKLLEEGHAVVIPNEEPAKDQDTGDDNSEGDTEESADDTSTSEGDAGDTEDDNTGDQDTENTDDDQGDSEPTPETLKAELEDIYLKEMDGPMGSEQKAKAALEAIGKERYAFDVDKRKTVDGIIEAIVEAAFKAE